jgi:DeoR/GlpR family transcriptional regulator of sugar metabolism
VAATAHRPQDAVFALERREAIARAVVEDGRLRVAEMASRFGVSHVTIRKDLETLEADGRLVRTHGGAISRRHPARPEPSYEIRERVQQDEKRWIGAAAAAMVRDGESIACDASSSALWVGRSLRSRDDWHHLTVLTTGLRLATELAGHPGITVLLVGGRVRAEALSVVGPLGDEVFRRVNVQTAFVGALGLTLDAGLSDATEEEAHVKRAMITAAREVYALVDHTKWNRTASATFCRTDQLTGIITDEQAPADMVGALRAMGVLVTQVAPREGS